MKKWKPKKFNIFQTTQQTPNKAKIPKDCFQNRSFVRINVLLNNYYCMLSMSGFHLLCVNPPSLHTIQNEVC